MSCSSPLYKWNKYTSSYSRIPCGYCMACRIDRRNYYQDRFEYDFYKTFKGVGTFGCITYDDNHIPLNVYGDMWSLRKKDVQNFWKRVRSYIRYHKINNRYINPNFKHYTVGEYSPVDFRPHYHFIAVGLDYAAALDIYERCWRSSVVIDSRPILQGGMSYVLKYLEKQQHGLQAVKQYDDNGLERPFLISSHCVGQHLFDNMNLDNATYHWNGRDVPLPRFVRNRLRLRVKPSLSSRVKDFAASNNMSYDDADFYLRDAKERSLARRQFARSPDSDVDINPRVSRTRIAFERPNVVDGSHIKGIIQY